MGLQDLDARFDAINTGQGTHAEAAVAALREAARTINDRIEGEPHQLVTVIQAIEVAGHQSASLLNTDGQPGVPSEPAPAGDRYDGMTVDELQNTIRDRNEGRDAEDRLHVSGSRTELLGRLREDDQRPGVNAEKS
jgi:hypothetical protein